MIVLFTDFGLAGPYIGQMKAMLAREAPSVPVIDLFADAPSRNPKAAAYLLGAYAAWFPTGTVFLCVVDPGVGGARAALAVEADGRWYVGPDNGLFELVRRRSKVAPIFEITEQPADLSASFHGRDLFAPAAARLVRGDRPQMVARDPRFGRHPDWPNDLAEIVYIDDYGNAMTGLRASAVPADAILVAGGKRIARARTFSDLPAGTALWYENSNGLAEIAVNLGRADEALGLRVGTPLTVTAQH
ncbi:MAG TPA: SAM-dependent chlorinase/fluorinase [Stellaceae bacterium]|nr:SAM-dependent chlorinase/fluorinase [Stellaceae bacterium]